MNTSRLTVVAHELPYPADHGGKVDTWNRLVGLSRLGIELQLITWANSSKPDRATMPDAVHAIVHDAIVLPRNIFRALRWHGTHPPRMLTYGVNGADRSKLARAVDNFGPDAILLEAWPAYLTATAVAVSVRRPLLYRSQNIEHLYLRHQAALACGLHRWKLLFNSYGFRRVEAEIRRNAAIVFDICCDDSEYWASAACMSRSVVLPPTWLGDHSSARDIVSRDIDVLFAGNLWTSNNVDGLLWFIEEVLPQIRTAIPRRLHIVLAGANPSPRLIRASEWAQVECVANPENIDAFTRRARVAINPVRRSSGVNIKMLTLLASGARIVATEAGTRGLPSECIALCGISSESAQFASRVIEALSDGSPVDMERRSDVLDRHFGNAALASLVDSINLLARGDAEPRRAPDALSLA